jgi:hypothetical protein
LSDIFIFQCAAAQAKAVRQGADAAIATRGVDAAV